MLLKRKRSANILSSPNTNTTTNSDSSSVQAFYPHSKPTGTTSPFESPNKSISFDCETPSHLNIRTRKRYRDNRPEASAVHGVSSSSSSSSSCHIAASCWLGAVINMRALADVSRVAASTIQRLYQAQQQQQHEQHPQHEPEHQSPLASAHLGAPQKSTLHTFWHISQPPQSQSQPQTSISTPTARCEDCDGSLQNEDAMEVDDGSSAEDKACGSCRRPICDGCAVFGRERVCAGCAGCERGW
jgi:hypothetical protein